MKTTMGVYCHAQIIKKEKKKDDRYVVDMASETSLSTLHAWRATT